MTAIGGSWKGLADLDIATCGWVRFNEQRLSGELGDCTPAEIEHDYAEPDEWLAQRCGTRP